MIRTVQEEMMISYTIPQTSPAVAMRGLVLTDGYVSRIVENRKAVECLFFPAQAGTSGKPVCVRADRYADAAAIVAEYHSQMRASIVPEPIDANPPCRHCHSYCYGDCRS